MAIVGFSRQRGFYTLRRPRACSERQPLTTRASIVVRPIPVLRDHSGNSVRFLASALVTPFVEWPPSGSRFPPLDPAREAGV
jgi:hypothetical protein